MRRLGLPLRRVVLSFLVAAATLPGASGVARAAPDCQVIALRGTATLERSGSRSALAAGAELGTGDWVETDAGARLKLRFADGSLVQLGENTRLRIDQAKFNQAEGRRNILLDLPIGLLRAAAAKSSSSIGSSFEIHTGIGYSAVRGTEWIMVAASEETRVYVQEGRVSVGTDFPSNQFPKLVEAGYWVVVRMTGIERIQASPPGSLDSLMEQTEAALTNGAPAGDADTAETSETEEADAVSNATSAATDTPDSASDPANSNGSTTMSATSATSGSATTAAGASAVSGSSSSSANSSSSPNSSPNKTSNGGSSSSSSGGGGGSGSSSSNGGSSGSSNSSGGKSAGGGGLSSKSGGGGKLK